MFLYESACIEFNFIIKSKVNNTYAYKLKTYRSFISKETQIKKNMTFYSYYHELVISKHYSDQ